MAKVIEFVHFQTQTEKADRFAEIYPALRTGFNSQPGCLEIRLLRDQKVPTDYFLVFEWESTEAQNAFTQIPSFLAWQTEIKTIWSTPPKAWFFDEIA